MAVKHNIIANYIGRIYLMVIGVVMVPIYLHYMGAEAYGLVGFFAIIEGWMLLLDIGLSPTISREVSKTIAPKSDKEKAEFKYLFHSVEFIYIVISLFLTVLIIFNSSWIANKWLNVELLNRDDVAYVVSLMGLMIGFRFIAILYRSGITASEEQVWYNKAKIVLSTIKYLGAYILLKFISTDFVKFFEFQLFIAFLEFVVFSFKFYNIMQIGRFYLYFSIQKIKPLLKFAISIAYTGGVWIFISQLDKLLLSNVLPLKEYGYFSLVATIAVAIIQISDPIHFAILPRLTALYSQKKMDELFELYKKSAQWITIIIFSVGGVVAYFSYELLYAWTGDIEASKWGKDVLFWYALGNSLLALTTLQIYLQTAYGKLKLNIIYYTVVLFLFSPIVYYVVHNYSVIYVAKLWFLFVLLTLIVWVPLVHHYLAPKVNFDLFFKIIAPITISTSLYLWIIEKLNFEFSQNRAILFATLLLIGGGLLVVNFLVSRLFYSPKKSV